MAAAVQSIPNHTFPGMEYQDIASAQESFARLAETPDNALSSYTKDLFQHTKAQLERVTRSNSASSTLTTVSSLSTESSVDSSAS